MTTLDVKPTYEFLSRTPHYRWWRPLLTLLAFAVLAIVLGGIAAGPMPANPVGDYAGALLAAAAMLPALLLAVRWVERRRIGTLSSVHNGLRWPLLLSCLGWAAIGYAVVVVATGGLTKPKDWLVIGIALLIVPIQAAAEEYVFRGWLLQTFSAWTRSPIVAAILSSLLFAAVHDLTNPLTIAYTVIFGLATCYLTIRTGGLEAAIALHVLNNVVSATEGLPNSAPGVWDVVAGLSVTLVYAWWVGRRIE